MILLLTLVLLALAGDLVADDPLCAPLYRIAGTEFCTYGDEAPPAEASGTIPPVVPGRLVCDHEGVKRVQVMYMHSGATPGQIAEATAQIRQVLPQVDAIFDESAHLTGGHRHIRFVMDANCEVNVIPFASDAWSMALIIRELIDAGHDSHDRKYLIFGEAPLYCGISTIRRDNFDQRDYAYIGRWCWFHPAHVAHEIVHMLGGVQLDAPNSSGGYHCTDQHDIMCYSDEPYYPPMRYVCPPEYGRLLDCNHDDYFHTDPPEGSYLAGSWNVANSAYLLRLVEWRWWFPMIFAPEGATDEN